MAPAPVAAVPHQQSIGAVLVLGTIVLTSLSSLVEKVSIGDFVKKKNFATRGGVYRGLKGESMMDLQWAAALEILQSQAAMYAITT